MGYEYRTTNGYNMFDMSSMLQKAIRRGDFTHAGFAANELYYSYYSYLWRRLLVISAEDCYGIMTKEIMALKEADDLVVNFGMESPSARGNKHCQQLSEQIQKCTKRNIT